jgi:hypothetical protein
MTQFYKTKKIVVGIIALFFAMTFTAKAQYTLTDGDVVIENGIITALTELGSQNIFSQNGQKIIIPEVLQGQTVKSIVDKPWTSNLDKRTEGVFGDMRVSNVTFPVTIENIGEDAFYLNCITILDLSYYTNLKTVGAWSFSGSENITQIDLSNLAKLNTIKAQAFLWQPIEKLNLSGCTSLTKIEDNAFGDNKLTEIDFSGLSSLTTIGKWAFQCQEMLTGTHGSIRFSGCTALSSIEERAFYQWNLENLDLSPCTSLIYIGRMAFFTRFSGISEFSLPTPQIDGLTFSTWQDGEGNSINEAKDYNLTAHYYIALFNEKVISLSGELVSNRGTETESSNASELKSATEAVHQVKFTIRNHSINQVNITSVSTSNGGTLSWSSGTIESGNEQEVTITYPGSNYENTIIVNGDNLKGNTTMNITERGDVSTDGNLVPTSTSKPKIEQSNISIYPNPVKNIVTIAVNSNTIPGQTISIINLAGNTVYQTSNFSNQQTIDISNLPGGIYFVKVGDEVTKLLKQ